MKQKEDKVLAQMIEKEDAELDGCTFVPESYTTKAPGRRNLNQFIKDQEKYTEFKSLNNQRKLEEKH